MAKLDEAKEAIVTRVDSELDRIEWADIEGIARELIKVWVDGSELVWAEHAWSVLVRQPDFVT